MTTPTAVLVAPGARRILLNGDDAHLGPALHTIIENLCDDLGVEQRNLAVEHVDADRLADAAWVASTPSLLGARILVVDHADAVDRDQLAAVLAAPAVDDVAVVAVWSGGRVPKAIAGIEGLVAITRSDPRNAGARRELIDTTVANAGLSLSPNELSALAARLGENPERIYSTVEVLAAHADDQGRIAADVIDTLGEGGAPPWLLSDAIEGRDLPGSVRAAHTLMRASSWAPLAVVGYLRKRYLAIWRIANGAEAPAGFAGRKQAQVARRLGAERATAALEHINTADANLKGASAATADGTIEVLVARLARL
jgi:DNA polymerase III delta subunit